MIGYRAHDRNLISQRLSTNIRQNFRLMVMHTRTVPGAPEPDRRVVVTHAALHVFHGIDTISHGPEAEVPPNNEELNAGGGGGGNGGKAWRRGS